MTGNCLDSIKDLTRDEKYTAALWLYRMANELERFNCHEGMMKLYYTLVYSLGLESHSKKVVDAVIERHKRAHELTLKENADLKVNDFDLNEPLSCQYKQDSTIYDKCGQWNGTNEEEINLIRAVFAGRQQPFALIVAGTFFYKDSSNRKTFSLPREIIIPKKIIAAAQKTGKVDFLRNSFGLTAEEAQILNVAYCAHTHKELYPVFNDLINQEEETRVSLYSRCTSLPIKKIKINLQGNKKLVSFGFMDTEGDISQEALDCIYSGDINVLFSDVLKQDAKKEIYPLSTFSVQKDESELALRLLNNKTSANILLYGAPGSGKTEYARTLARKSGLVPLIFKNELEVDNEKVNSETHALSRLNCLLSLQKKDSVIIVDEAESVLSTNSNLFSLLLGGGECSRKKGTVNTMLENSVNKVIWILNYTSPLDESTLRRFTYSINFKEMSRTMLKTIADSKLSKICTNNHLRNELVDLCGEYHVTGASVDNMVKTVEGMNLSREDESAVVGDVKKVLEANSTLLYGKPKMRSKVKDSYDLSILNTSTPPEDIVNMVVNAQKFSEKNNSEETGIRMLFYGVSGTGKTELARYLADKLNKKILLKRASDIFGPYVGQEEAAIKGAFEEAEASGDILLFDEADSFFADRTNATANWQRTMVNEFLTQMEEFSGILICTTNLRQIMDPAMQRRFHIIAEFKPLAEAGIKKLLIKFFSSCKFNKEQIETISSFDSVTPGDFGSLADKIRFMPPESITSGLITNELCKIQEEKSGTSKRIGFAC